MFGEEEDTERRGFRKALGGFGRRDKKGSWPRLMAGGGRL